MIKLLVILLATASAQSLAGSVLDWYFCLVGGSGTSSPDQVQIYPHAEAVACTSTNSDCFCAVIANRCMFGPCEVSEGNEDDCTDPFLIQDVSVQVANSCGRDFCLCTSHPDFLETVDERYDQSLEETVERADDSSEEGLCPGRDLDCVFRPLDPTGATLDGVTIQHPMSFIRSRMLCEG